MIPNLAEQIVRLAQEHREDQERRAERVAIATRSQKKSVKKRKLKKEVK